MMAKIPIAHLSGGELTEGAIDDSIRHAITKMSHLHFVATEEYKKRVIQLGEHPNRVYNYGEAGLNNIKNLDLMSKINFEKSINFTLNKKSLLITYHPTTLDTVSKIENDFKTILDELDLLEETSLLFTKANSDEGGRLINSMIDNYVKANAQNAIAFTSLGQLRYLSALQYVDAVFGNTSSGIVEAPSFKIGTINIGDRQKGRTQSTSIINATNEKKSINKAIKILYSDEFQSMLKDTLNPYENENSSYNTKEILKNIDLENIVKKSFWDIK